MRGTAAKSDEHIGNFGRALDGTSIGDYRLIGLFATAQESQPTFATKSARRQTSRRPPLDFPIPAFFCKMASAKDRHWGGKSNGRATNSLRRWSQLRADDGNLEPVRWRDIP
jgi:hypothetical protein